MHPSDLRVHHTLLDRGLRLVTVQQPLLHGICVSLHLNVGPRFENANGNGLSHMLEHMLFRGTPTHPNAHALALAVERLGGTLYASTSTDHGHMSVTLPPENFAQGLALFGEVFSQPIFADIEVERGIIREEILEGLDDDGHSIDPDDLSRALVHPSHALGMPITGTLATVDAIDEAALRAHHTRFYTGNNVVLCIAGPVEGSLCEDLVAKHFCDVPVGSPVEISPPPDQASPRFQYTENQGSQTDLRVAFRAPGRDHPLEPATELLVRLLDDGMSTRLYARICDEQGLCYDVSADYEPFADDGILDLAAAVRHVRAPLVTRELYGIVLDLANRGPTEEELRIGKKRHHWGIESLLDHAEGLADYHGLSHLFGHDLSLVARRDQIEQVTRDQVVEAARYIFRPSRCSTVAVGMLRRGQRKEIEQAVGILAPTN
jgi:predicted Zn-dependent peptidase